MTPDQNPSRSKPGKWDASVDVVVIGLGYAGGVTAIEAHDAGAEVMILEKMPDPGGISITSGGSVRFVEDVKQGFAYLKATCADTTPDDVLEALAQGMSEMPAYFEKLVQVNGARYEKRLNGGNYPFPGRDTFGFISISEVPGFEPAKTYPYVSSFVPIERAPGVRLFHTLYQNIRKRGIEVKLETPAQRLITDSSGAVIGVTASHNGRHIAIEARRGVVLTCGGFEAGHDIQRQFWQEKPVLNAAFLGNTGDGIRMAQDVGAELWHMWHWHGVYGFRHPDPAYPFGLRPKRLPDWVPGVGARADVKMPWIIVDRAGRRYMNEYPPYAQDTSWRHMATLDTETMSYLRIPSIMIMDAPGRGTYPLVSPTFNDRRLKFDWSEATLRALEDRIVRKADSVEALAEQTGIAHGVLASLLRDWNAACASGADEAFGRPPSSMMTIATPPYYWAEVWPVCSNTHGGPVHDVEQRVLDGYRQPIPGLYAAGECGGVFGHLYIGGGNLAECFVGGRTAGRNAAQRKL
ncbi:MAG: FAD-dependent oxidoreductase [Hyphomicrobiaceae bacterium]|nr:FAD-dependent oxidoreductase [Hyphomicrobiaceae bacterium]